MTYAFTSITFLFHFTINFGILEKKYTCIFQYLYVFRLLTVILKCTLYIQYCGFFFYNYSIKFKMHGFCTTLKKTLHIYVGFFFLYEIIHLSYEK